MLRNGVDCATGRIVFQDAAMSPELQCTKKHQDETSSMPDESLVKVHAAEALRQVKGAGVVEGGWIGGNA